MPDNKRPFRKMTSLQLKALDDTTKDLEDAETSRMFHGRGATSGWT